MQQAYPLVCCMYLKQIITRNVQNHREVVIDLPPTGLVVFMGDNSNGKSVIVKATRDLLQNNIKRPQCRADLINRQASFAEITYIRGDDVALTLHLTREAANTYVSYVSPNESPITRYLADKSYMELVRLFGWHYDTETGVTLNIAEGDDALLFYKTPNKTNCKVIQSATTDPIADTVLENFDATLKETRNFRDNAANSARLLTSTLQELKVYDTEALSKRKELLSYYYRNLSAVYYPNIPEIKAVPDVHWVSIYIPQLPKIKYPKVYKRLQCQLPDLHTVVTELESLKNQVCPTCGRGFGCGC